MQSSLDFDRTHEMFADGIGRYLKAHASEISTDEGTVPSGIWNDFAEMGVMGLSISEELGGSDSPLHLATVMEVFGRHRLNGSEIIAGVIGSRLMLGASADTRDAMLSEVARGSLRLAFADGESRGDGVPTVTFAVGGPGFVVNGEVREAIRGARPDRYLISGRAADNPTGSLMLLAVDTADLRDCVDDFGMIDGSRGARIRFSDTAVSASSLVTPDADGVVDDAKAWGLLCLCWEATGAMVRLLDITIAYSKVRRQFGVPIGTFQALQHMMVEMQIHAEQSRDAALLATHHIDCADRIAKRVALSSAKFQIGRSAKFVRESAVQIHGAIGMTDEIEVTKHFKRLMVIEQTLGSSDDHIEVLVDAEFKGVTEPHG